MSMTTADRINPNAINDADRGTARELLSITESAVDSLSRNHRRSGFTNRDEKTDSSFVNVLAGNTVDVENFSADSQSSTASEILRRSTHASAAFSVPPSVASSARSNDAARLVRVPVKVLREVPLPQGGRVSGGVAASRDNCKANITLQRKPGQHVSAADKSISNETTGRKSDKLVSQDSEETHFNAKKLPVDNARTYINSSASGVLSSDEVKPNAPVLSESCPVHPLMAILDSGYLTQPIHTIVPEESLLPGDSHSVSRGTSASPIDISAKDKETRKIEYPEIVTVHGRKVDILPTAQPAHRTAASADSSDTDLGSSKPFVALKDRFLQFRPVAVKQGTETNEPNVVGLTGEVLLPSDDVHIEKFSLDENQRRLRQAFVTRKADVNLPTKKLVPARVVPATAAVTDIQATPADKLTASPAASADTVASAAVAAVVATQTYMKSQQDIEARISEILSKIAILQSAQQTASQIAPAAKSADADVAKYQNKLDELEAQLSELTHNRLDYLEKLHQQQLDVQMQLLALARQNTAGNNGNGQHQMDSRSLAEHLSQQHLHSDTAAAARSKKIEDASAHDDHEGASLLDTPAPRRRPPVPTQYETTAAAYQPNRSSHYMKTSSAQSDQHLLAEILASHDMPPNSTSAIARPNLQPHLNVHQNSTLADLQSADALVSQSAATKSSDKVGLNNTFSLTPEKLTHPTPLDKYLDEKPHVIGTSPYPALKAAKSSHMPALVQYAEAEAVLKKVQETSLQLKNNLDLVLQSRYALDTVTDQTSLAERTRIRKLVDERVKTIVKQLKIETEEVLRTNDPRRQQVMMPERDVISRPKRPVSAANAKLPGVRPSPSSAGYGYRYDADIALTHSDESNKENVSRPTKLKKPRPLDPVKDADYMKRIYGRALFHRLRTERNEACRRYHSSPKSKLPRTPVKMSRAIVKGVEVASANTQTSKSPDVSPLSAGTAALPTQFVVGLHGELIPMAIPVKLPRQRTVQHEQQRRVPSPPQRELPLTPQASVLTREHKSPPQMQPPPPSLDDNNNNGDDEEEGSAKEDAVEMDDQSSMSEEMPAISLPGHTAPPINYEGPEFPVPEVQPLPRSPAVQQSSDEMALRIKRADVLQTEVIDWVEQELMARIVCEMHDRHRRNPVIPSQLNPGRRLVDHASEASSDAADAETTDDPVIVDAIGQSGVQLFVDAGRPVDSVLVTALVSEVLAEKISAMFAERLELEHTARQHTTVQPADQPDTVTTVISKHMDQRSPVPTPVPTPTSTPTQSMSQHVSPPSTPELSQTANLVQLPPAEAALPTAEAAESLTDDAGDFPSYHGLSDAEGEGEPAVQPSAPFTDQRDVTTPVMTLPKSVTSPLRTLSPSSLEEPPAIDAAAGPPPTLPDTQLPPAVSKQPSVKMVDAATECGLVSVRENWASSPVQPSSPAAVSEQPTSSMHTVSDSAAVSTDVSVTATANECVSEGQWLVNVLSEGEVPDLEANELLKQRIRKHLLNASRRQCSSDDEDTLGFVGEIDADLPADGLPSEGEVMFPAQPLAEHIATLCTAVAAQTADSQPHPKSSEQQFAASQHDSIEHSLGEISNDQEPLQFNGVGYQQMAVNSSVGDEHCTRPPFIQETSADNGLSSEGEYHQPAESVKMPKLTLDEFPSGELQPADRRNADQPAASSSGVRKGIEQRPLMGRVTSTLDSSPRPRRQHFSPPGTKVLDIQRSQSPQHAKSSALPAVHSDRFSAETGNATASDLFTRTMTPDQMNTEALLQSRDYLAASTGFSDTAGNEPLRSTYSVQEMGESHAETALSGRSDVALAGGHASATEDELREMFNVPRRVITIPTTNQFDDGVSGSDDEVSELSFGQ